MNTLFVLALLLALYLQPAAATSPAMDFTVSMASPYPDPDNILAGFCELCGMSLCAHASAMLQLQRPPTFTAETFLDHPDWPQDLPVFEDTAPIEPEALLPHLYDPNLDAQPLRDEFVGTLDDNATTITPEIIQVHVEGTYTPGDRTQPRRGSQRRQQPRLRGFPCTHDNCEKIFDRSCDLKRHSKTHLKGSERPHKCSVCFEGFLYPKDRDRHQRTHDRTSSSQTTLFCRIPGCNNVDGFSRRDNLLRHQRKKHPHLVASM